MQDYLVIAAVVQLVGTKKVFLQVLPNVNAAWRDFGGGLGVVGICAKRCDRLGLRSTESFPF